MSQKVACITGANKGIGFEIAKQLALNGFLVIMGCRNLARAKEAECEISNAVKGAQIEHVQIDLDDPKSAQIASQQVFHLFPAGIDVLVNNAGFAYSWDEKKPFHDQAVDSIRRNYFGTVAVCEAMVPLIKENGRLVNVSSISGSLTTIPNRKLADRWRSCKTKESIEELLHEFIELTKSKGKHLEAGWPDSAYGVSKLALTTYTRVLGQSTSRLHIFSCCPGACQTEMSSYSGNKTAAQGADTPMWLAISQEALKEIPQGGFSSERKSRNE